MDVRKIEYQDEDVLLEATVAVEPKATKMPLILIFHAWEGKGAFVEEKAKELAKLGYIGCAIDLYGKGVLGKSKEENSALMQPLVSDRKKLQKRILAYKNLLPKIPEADLNKIGAIGFCFGGLCALDLARCGADIKGVVSFHGILHCPDSENSIRAKILVLHGNNDPMVSLEELISFTKEMEKKKADWQLHIFGNTMHAFTNKQANDPSFGTVYQKDSDRRSFIYMQEFFKEVF